MKNRHIISRDGAKIVYDVEGNGEPMVLLHGSGATKEVWKTNGWTDILKNYYTVIALDLRGYGESETSQTSEFFEIEKILADIEMILEKEGFSKTPFIIMGHSYGATIGLQAIKAGMNIKKAILAGTNRSNYFFEKRLPDIVEEYELLQKEKDCQKFDKKYTKEDIEWIQTKVFDGLDHNNLVDKADICLTYIMDTFLLEEDKEEDYSR